MQSFYKEFINEKIKLYFYRLLAGLSSQIKHPDQPAPDIIYPPINQVTGLIIPKGPLTRISGIIFGVEENGIIRQIKHFEKIAVIHEINNKIEDISPQQWGEYRHNYYVDVFNRRRRIHGLTTYLLGRLK